ncbi:MAG: CvpA family protein [Candidatus Aminicenantia bacterium]
MEEGFPWVDILFLAIILYTFIMGFLKGLLKEIISISFFVVGLIIALNKGKILSRSLNSFIKLGVFCDFLSFFIILIFFIILGAVFAFILRKILIRGPVKFIDRIMGSIFGAIKGFLIVFIIIILVISYFPNFKLMEKSFICFYTFDITIYLAKFFPSDIYEKYQKNLTKHEERGRNGKRI